MDDITLERPCEADALELRLKLRHADLLEVQAASGPRVSETIEKAIEASPSVYTVRAKATGDLLCIFGCVPLDLMQTTGTPWMLGTDLLRRHARSLVRVTRVYFDDMLAHYSLLMNFVDARNAQSIRLIRGVGCEVGNPVPYGVSGKPFRPFWRERDHV